MMATTVVDGRQGSRRFCLSISPHKDDGAGLSAKSAQVSQEFSSAFLLKEQEQITQQVVFLLTCFSFTAFTQCGSILSAILN